MNCPKCKSPPHLLRTVLTRHDTFTTTVRRKWCMTCGHRWYTAEVDIGDKVKWGCGGLDAIRTCDVEVRK